MPIKTSVIRTVIEILRDDVVIDENGLVDEVYNRHRNEYKNRDVVRRIVKRILEDYLRFWGLVMEVEDGRWVWVDYYYKPKLDMHLHTLDLIQWLKPILDMDTVQAVIEYIGYKGLNEDLMQHLEVEYPSLYKLLNRFNIGSASKIPFGLIDVYIEFLEKLKMKTRALVKYVEAGGSFKYRACSICRPKKTET